MLSIAAASANAQGTHRYLSSDEYYSEGEAVRGEWFGQGAAAWGLHGQVERRHFLPLYEGKHPFSGERLTQKPPRKEHFPGWDFTFSAPKSVSVLWALAPPETRVVIEAAHRSAVRGALRRLERDHLLTKRGKGGAEREPLAGIAAALYQHITSRELDPQLHTHAFVFNVALRHDGSTGTVLSQPAFDEKLALGAHYRVALAAALQRDLGLKSVRTETGFELAAVPKTLLGLFSKRRATIKAELDRSGRSGGKAAAEIALKTRPTKRHQTKEALFAKWARQAAALGLAFPELSHPDEKTPHPSPEELRAVAADQLAETATVTREQLFTRVAEAVVDRAVNPVAVAAAVVHALSDTEAVVPLGVQRGRAEYASVSFAEAEQLLIAAARRANLAQGKAPTEALLAGAIKSVESRRDIHFTAQQRAALRTITNKEGLVHVLTGLPGTGKTTVLEAAVDAWQATGLKVVGAAPHQENAALLAEHTGAKSSTVRQVLADLRVPGEQRPFLTRAARLVKRGIIPALLDEFRPSKDTVLVVERAETLSMRRLTALVSAVTSTGARLVLVSEERHSSPSRGLLASLQGAARRHLLATAVLAAQPPVLHPAPSGDLQTELVRAWRQAGGALRPRENLIAAPSREDVDKLNLLARRQRFFQLGLKAALVWRGLRPRAFYYGDRVRLTATVKAWGVTAGDLGTVIPRRSGHGPGWLAVKLDRGAVVHIHCRSFRNHLELGYAVDAAALHGRDVPNVYALYRPVVGALSDIESLAAHTKGTLRLFAAATDHGSARAVLERLREKSTREVPQQTDKLRVAKRKERRLEQRL